FQHYRSVNVNAYGNVEAYLPTGRYQLEISPNSLAYTNTRSTVFDIPGSSELPIPTSIELIAMIIGSHGQVGMASLNKGIKSFW
ncbi:MAG: hypothetical protein EBX07_04420, partial [Burkholderiaceae bacterium]|nr:hypothetical protein [Burkholderiaceae bacterium]